MGEKGESVPEFPEVALTDVSCAVGAELSAKEEEVETDPGFLCESNKPVNIVVAFVQLK